ncbi:hypothetical protein OAA19_01030 [Rubripirellula sp.]|nr:hypothetical protein [Rubripirellula sp.]MDB4338670.1 hypothetical protein [Rubripirellula sp.]
MRPVLVQRESSWMMPRNTGMEEMTPVVAVKNFSSGVSQLDAFDGSRA